MLLGGPTAQNGSMGDMVEVTQREDGRWQKPCPECGEMQDYLRRNYAVMSAQVGKLCKKCSNRKTENSHRGLYHDIRISWFQKFRISAEIRKIDFYLTIDDVWKIYIDQNKQCALSGLPVGWASVGSIHTASLDRIDSSKPYTVDNTQIVHKDINMMKQAFSQEHFIKMCAAVADKVKW